MHAVTVASTRQPAATEVPRPAPELGDTSQSIAELPASGPGLGPKPSDVCRDGGFGRAAAAFEAGGTGHRTRIAPAGVARA